MDLQITFTVNEWFCQLEFGVEFENFQFQKYLHESRHLHAVRRNRSNGGRFIGKRNDLGETEKVTPRETESLSTLSQAANIHQNVRLGNPQQASSAASLLSAHPSLQHTMIQIQNNLPVMTSTVQHSSSPVVGSNSSSELSNTSTQLGHQITYESVK